MPRTPIPLLVPVLAALSWPLLSSPCGDNPQGFDRDGSAGDSVRLFRAQEHSVEVLDADADLLIKVLNLRQLSGTIEIAATVFSEHQLVSTPAVTRSEVAAASQILVGLPVACLSLPRQPLAVSGLLTLTGTICYENGTTETVSSPLELFFHPEGDSWLLYDEQTKAELFDGGALTQEERTGHAGSAARFGPTIAAKVSESTGWRPATDEKPQTHPEARPAATPLPTAGTKRGTVKICIEQIGVYSDAGVGEDFWQSTSPTARASRGAYATISRAASPPFTWSGYLGDGRGDYDPGSGCTSELPGVSDSVVAYTYQITIESRGRVQGNDINAAYDGSTVLDWHFNRGLVGNGTHTVSFDPTNNTGKVFDVYMVGAYSLYRHSGGVSGEEFRYRLISGTDSGVDRDDDIIKIGDQRSGYKFIIAHETGHLLGDFATGNHDFKTVHTNCECYDSYSCPSEHGSHTMISKEYSRCAVAEGFAHFYAAAVFNSHTDGSPYECWFHYYKEVGGDNSPTVNCELDSPDGPFDELYMETNCYLPWAGMGTELDWLRTFWDVLSDQPAPLGMEEVTAWLDSADYWHNYRAYNELDAEANTIGGDLNTKWDLAKWRNGVDWAHTGTTLFTDDFESETTGCWSDSVP